MERIDSPDGIRIAVRYCGGCNPVYDALRAKEAIENSLGRQIQPFDDADPPDICLLIKQCQSDCFAESGKLYSAVNVLLARADGVMEAARQIESEVNRLNRNAEYE